MTDEGVEVIAYQMKDWGNKHLAPASRGVVLNTFDECHSEGRTIVLVTHDLVAAERAGRRLILQDGVISEGSPGRLKVA